MTENNRPYLNVTSLLEALQDIRRRADDVEFALRAYRVDAPELATFRGIIEIWPKRKDFAALIDVPESTASSMWQLDQIPSGHFSKVVSGARALGHNYITHELLCDIAAARNRP